MRVREQVEYLVRLRVRVRGRVAHLSKARPTKVWPECRHASFPSARGGPKLPQAPDCLGQSADHAGLAGHIRLIFDIARGR